VGGDAAEWARLLDVADVTPISSSGSLLLATDFRGRRSTLLHAATEARR